MTVTIDEYTATSTDRTAMNISTWVAPTVETAHNSRAVSTAVAVEDLRIGRR